MEKNAIPPKTLAPHFCVLYTQFCRLIIMPHIIILFLWAANTVNERTKMHTEHENIIMNIKRVIKLNGVRARSLSFTVYSSSFFFAGFQPKSPIQMYLYVTAFWCVEKGAHIFHSYSHSNHFQASTERMASRRRQATK